MQHRPRRVPGRQRRLHVLGLDERYVRDALGTTRCRLRIRAEGGGIVDFYSSGGPVRCRVIQPTTGFPAGTVLSATCSYTRANIALLVTINCAAAFRAIEGGE